MTINHTSAGLDSSTSGLPVLVTAITVPGQLVHTAPTAAGSEHYVTLWVNNNHSADVEVKVYVVASGTTPNGTTPVASSIIVPPKSGKAVVEPGIRIASGVRIYIVASVADVVTYQGYVYSRTDV